MIFTSCSSSLHTTQYYFIKGLHFTLKVIKIQVFTLPTQRFYKKKKVLIISFTIWDFFTISTLFDFEAQIIKILHKKLDCFITKIFQLFRTSMGLQKTLLRVLVVNLVSTTAKFYINSNCSRSWNQYLSTSLPTFIFYILRMLPPEEED